MKDLNLYLIRHGQTEWNVKEQMQGSQNSPLTDDGINGAIITGKHLKDIPFIEAYSSPQQRAIETRDYILSVRDEHIPVKTSDWFREMDFGIWEGMQLSNLEGNKDFHYYMNEPSKYDLVAKGEKYIEVLERMQKGLDEVIKNTSQDNGNILIVSHGTALRVLLCVLSGGDWHRHRDNEYFPRLSNTSISVVNYKGDAKHGQYDVKYVNNVDHLPK